METKKEEYETKGYDTSIVYEFNEYPDARSGRCDNCDYTLFKSSVKGGKFLRECRRCGMKKIFNIKNCADKKPRFNFNNAPNYILKVICILALKLKNPYFMKQRIDCLITRSIFKLTPCRFLLYLIKNPINIFVFFCRK